MLSPAQQQLVRSTANRIKVKAFAGSGKTYSALQVPIYHPDKFVQMLVFNKANAMETNAKAQEMGLRNFAASTIHSIAYQMIWPTYQDKGKEIREFSSFDISRAYQLDKSSAKTVFFAIRSFLASKDLQPSLNHLNSKSAHLLPVLERVWADMTNPRSSTPLSMDGILKLFQLGEFQFNAGIIIADEYQDQTDCFAQIIESQKARVIAIGDPHQSIYGFRNAYGAMSRFKASEEIILSNCYRFGQGVALIASAILDIAKDEPNILVGRGSHQVTEFSINGAKPFGVVCRTNAALIENALDACNAGYSINIIGGLEKARPDMLMPLSSLYRGEVGSLMIRGTQIINSWSEVKDYAKKTDDSELMSGIRLTELIDGKADETLRLLQSRYVDQDKAHVVLGTAHGWKGFEMDQIAIGHDFKMPSEAKNDQDINLLYIALTRAKKALLLPDNLVKWLDENDLSIDMINVLQANGLNHKARFEVRQMIESEIELHEQDKKAGMTF